MQNRLAALEDAHAAFEQIGVVRAAGVEREPDVALARNHEPHIHAAPGCVLERRNGLRVGHEVAEGEPGALLGMADRR